MQTCKINYEQLFKVEKLATELHFITTHAEHESMGKNELNCTIFQVMFATYETVDMTILCYYIYI